MRYTVDNVYQILSNGRSATQQAALPIITKHYCLAAKRTQRYRVSIIAYYHNPLTGNTKRQFHMTSITLNCTFTCPPLWQREQRHNVQTFKL